MARTNGLERWRGEVSEQLKDIVRRQDDQCEAIEKLGDRLEKALKEHAAEDDQVAHAAATRLDEVSSALNKRLMVVERAQSTLLGKSTVIGTLIGAVVGAIVTALARKYIG